VNAGAAPRTVGLGVALVSLCLLTTELALTRLFSVTIWYHFAFLAISVALFGTGAAALLVHLIQHRLPAERAGVHLARGCLALGAVTAASAWLLLRFTPDMATSAEPRLASGATLDLVVTFVAAAAPFFAGGFVISLAMTRWSRVIHSLYSFDLAGAGLGCLTVIPALWLLGAPLTLVAAGALACAAGLLFAPAEQRGRGAAPGILALSLAALAATGPLHGLFEVRRAKGLDLHRLDIEYNGWNSFSMVTVLGGARFRGWGMSPAFAGELSAQKTLVIDMNAMTPLVGWDGDPRSARHVLWDLSAFVHHVRPWSPPRRVCVIGAGGGRDVLAALAAGARRVTGVEINPLIVDEVMRGRYRDWTGDLYGRADVDVVVDDGRGFVRRSTEPFDVIHLSMVDTSAATAAGAYSLTENSLHTEEAFADYLERLAPDGLLSVSSPSLPGLAGGAALSALAWRAVRDAGGDPARQIAALSTVWIGRPGCRLHNIIVRKSPFEAAEVESIAAAAARLRFDVSFLPGAGARPDGAGGDDWIPRILSARSDGELAGAVAGLPLDVAPATDDRPFFFYQNRLSDLTALVGTARPGYLFGGGLFILAKVALVAGAMVLLFLLLPVLVSRRALAAGSGPAAADLAYVACLGLGFMCVEIALIQKFTLFLGQPTWTLAVVLFVLLVGGAAGSRLFGRLAPGRRRRDLAVALAALCLLLSICWLAHGGDALLAAAAGSPAAVRIALSAALLAPTGLLLGMPYPAGLAAVAARAGTRIPWLWSVNSATSVLGSVTAVLVSMHSGITATIGVGVALYLLALPLSRIVTREARP
jgi:SAM-dependent methyltransferase